jgi:hypothetical protein
MNRKEHLTQDGLRQIVGIRAAMNNGLSEQQKQSFQSPREAQGARDSC